MASAEYTHKPIDIPVLAASLLIEQFSPDLAKELHTTLLKDIDDVSEHQLAFTTPINVAFQTIDSQTARLTFASDADRAVFDKAYAAFRAQKCLAFRFGKVDLEGFEQDQSEFIGRNKKVALVKANDEITDDKVGRNFVVYVTALELNDDLIKSVNASLERIFFQIQLRTCVNCNEVFSDVDPTEECLCNEGDPHEADRGATLSQFAYELKTIAEVA